MRKVLFILGLTIVLSLAIVGVASANNGPHGGYTPTTDACAGCHRAHTSIDPTGYLLVQSSVYELCITCHGSTGSGANTDVLDGLYINGRVSNANQGAGKLNGGGFLFMSMSANTWSPAADNSGNTAGAGAIKTTSAHNVEGMPSRGYEAGAAGSGETAPAWGGGKAVGLAWDGNWPAGSTATLECTSCHNPHGSTNYRILNDSGTWTADKTGFPAVNTSYTFQQWQVISTPSDYGPNRYSNFPGNGGYGVFDGIGFGGDPQMSSGNYTVGMNKFCANCHQRYDTATSPSPRTNPNTYWVGSIFTSSGPAGSNAWGSQFPDFGVSKPTGPGYDAGDGHGAMDRYRHSVQMNRSSYLNPNTYFVSRGNLTSWPLMQMRLAVTDGAGMQAVSSASGPNGQWVYTPQWTSDPGVNTDAKKANQSAYATCLTCHYAHGTAATQVGFATKSLSNGVYGPNPSQVAGQAAGVAPANDSALLFYDNRGVCQNCHKMGGALYGIGNGNAPVYNNLP